MLGAVDIERAGADAGEAVTADAERLNLRQGGGYEPLPPRWGGKKRPSSSSKTKRSKETQKKAMGSSHRVQSKFFIHFFVTSKLQSLKSKWAKSAEVRCTYKTSLVSRTKIAGNISSSPFASV